MKHSASPQIVDGQDYTVLRQTGTQAGRAQLQLNLADADARRLERLFQSRAGRGLGDPQLPKFARHDRHVAAVMAQGGFWALSERRIGRDGVAICLPLVPPAP